ncbi:LysE family translocator [Shewanella algae]|uniref:LysE family translocator n=1 Tax=Shewanella algae TaxID=38313 RepID=UPI001AAD21E6|nr:LysE family transporter [Shewanella algae]MBO2559942.1 LysE family transporter [Shewanella algae]MBO2564144.1 LysE family transporter [Shewanella algae]MBO2657179.1 LysE family transporter [Shewanella algae]MCE9780765.1 LysE family transporter [Shewanella algae]MCE9825524.1 LysE family transporter [Shewanella algae]
MLELFAVASITMLAVISPGADFAMVSRNSMVLGRRAGLMTSAGISLGVWVHVLYSIAGIGLLISQSLWLFSLIKFAGAAYLIYLGITMLRSKAVEASELQTQEVISDWAALKSGFLTNALNPKTTLFVVALFTQVIDPQTSTLTQIGYGAFMSAAHLVWFSLVALLFSSQAARRSVARCRHWVERAIGGVLVSLGLGLAFSSVGRS